MRIAVAVSGGVDSLCALLLLRRAGHDVLALHGFFLPEQSHPRPGGACDPLPGLEAACRALDIPLHTVDLRAVFQREVMIPFARSYAEGRTPNPCARCNRAVKFGALLDAALALGADKLATGHYARLLPGRNGEKDAPPVLAAAHDRAKDQSYFLSLVPAARLRHSFFPLADQDKARSVALVAAAGLAVPLPRESQDICFVPENDAAYRPFLTAQWRVQGLPPPEKARYCWPQSPAVRRTACAKSDGIRVSGATPRASARAWASPTASRCMCCARTGRAMP